MAVFNDYIKFVPGLQYVYDDMQLLSAPGRREMLARPFVNDTDVLQRCYNAVDAFVAILSDEGGQMQVVEIGHALMQLHDIVGTLKSLEMHIAIDEVELFEIKKFVFLCGKIRRAVCEMGLQAFLPFPDVSPVFDILDPDKTGVPSFYIYDSYDQRLAQIRHSIKACGDDDGGLLAELYAQQLEVCQGVIATLQSRIECYAGKLCQALHLAAQADIFLAQARQTLALGLVRPTLGASKISYTKLFNPRLRQHNIEAGLRYQSVDIAIDDGPCGGACVVTGANMAGKTVLLKSLAVAQVMAQCGMFVPAEQASLSLVDDVALCFGDQQNEMSGLSSFASEITKISNVVMRSRGERLLVLIDEPARTTNPVEGYALVCAIVAELGKCAGFAVITTHYGNVGSGCQRLRVRGFVEEMADVPLTPETINRFMDYSLLSHTAEEVPHEALRIAALLGCDEGLLQSARSVLDR